MALGDGSMKFGFSRMGMGLDEQRQAESKFRGEQAAARTFRATERMGRRAYKDAARRGDTAAAFDIMQKMTQSGFGAVGNYAAGEAEAMVSGRLERKLGNLTRAKGSFLPGSTSKTGEQDLTGIASSPASASGPLESKALNPREQFAADLKRSDLIASGDPEARQRAYERGDKLGVARDQIRGFLEKNVDGYSGMGAADLVFDKAKESSLSTNTNPLRAESEAIGKSLSGLQNQTAYNAIDPDAPKQNASNLLLSMAAKMGLKGQGAADWISNLRETASNKTQQKLAMTTPSGLEENIMAPAIRAEEDVKRSKEINSLLENKILKDFNINQGLLNLVSKY